MSDVCDLYQELIIDHGRRPRNFTPLENANHIQEGYNPLCGDRLTVYLQEENGIIQNAHFVGAGCAISMASASLMTESLKGKSLSEARSLFDNFRSLMTGEKLTIDTQQLGKLIALSGVAEYPSRIKCATLSWHTMMQALTGEKLLHE